MGCDGWLNTGIEEYENFTDTIALYDWAFDNFAYRTAVSSTNVVTRVHVDMASEEDANVNSPRPERRFPASAEGSGSLRVSGWSRQF